MHMLGGLEGSVDSDWLDYPTIVQEALIHDVSLIVLGTNIRPTFSSAVLGSVADQVARAAPCPVLFVHPDGFDKIVALEPDLVLAFSDLQADLAAELVRRGISVVTFNQRTIDEILQMIRMVGGLVGCQADAERLAELEPKQRLFKSVCLVI